MSQGVNSLAVVAGVLGRYTPIEPMIDLALAIAAGANFFQTGAYAYSVI